MTLKTQDEKKKWKPKLKLRIVVGYLSMLLGIALPLASFTALSYFEWKTHSRYTDFLQGVQTQSSETLANLETFKAAYHQSLGEDSGRYVDPFSAKDYTVRYGVDNQDPDFIFAYLRIPKLDLYQPVRLGATAEHLSTGAAHVDGTSLPVGGVNTRTVIAGHRGMYNNRMFLNVHELQKGDEAEITNVLGQRFIYRVRDQKIVTSTAWEELLPEKGKDLLTLMTCDPWVPPSPNRLLVHFERVPEVVPEKQKPEETSRLVDTDTGNVNVPFSIRATQYGMYVGMAALWSLFFWTLRRFVAYLRAGSAMSAEHKDPAKWELNRLPSQEEELSFPAHRLHLRPARLQIKEIWTTQKLTKKRRFYAMKKKRIVQPEE